jgi:hypothetical protein
MLGVEDLDVLRFDIFQPIDDGSLEFLGVFLGGRFQWSSGRLVKVMVFNIARNRAGDQMVDFLTSPARARISVELKGMGGNSTGSRGPAGKRDASNVLADPVGLARAAIEIIAVRAISCHFLPGVQRFGLVGPDHQQQLR